MGKKYKFSDDEIKRMVKMYVNDLEAIHNIAKEYGVDSSVIKQRLVDNGVKIAKGSAYSVNYWKQRGLTEIEAEEHIKTIRPVNTEYWIKKGYSEEDAKLYAQGQRLCSLNGCIMRFGEEEGKKIWDSRELKRSEAGKLGSANIQYWVNKGYSEEEAIELRRKRQSTFSLDKCIEKYGEEEGVKRFNQRQVKWQESLYKNGKLKSGYSQISQDLFFDLIKEFEINHLNEIFFALKGGEFILSDKNGFYRYDFVDLKNKKIIEYNGDVYHGNPNKYKADDNPHPFAKDISAQEIWDKDKRKIDLAINNGFEVLTIWDSDYRLGDKQEILNNCLVFLNKK